MSIVNRLKVLVSEERRITTEVLKLLMRVEDERIFAEIGYSSIYDFCRKELKYSEGAAYRRISAMRLLRENSGVGEKLTKGELSLTTASQVQTALAKTRKAKVKVSLERRSIIVEQVAGKSKREVEKTLAEEIVSLVPHAELMVQESEKLTHLSNGLYRLELVVPEELIGGLDRLLAQHSHAVPSGRYLDLLKYLVKGKCDRLKEEGQKCEREFIESLKPSDVKEPMTDRNLAGEVKVPQKLSAGEAKSRYIPLGAKRAVMTRDQGRCTYVDSLTGRRCGAVHFVQLDHIIPVSLGGSATENNLRLLCGVHNRLVAEKLGMVR